MTDQELVQALRCCAKGLGHDDKCENCKVGEIQNRREYIEFAAANAIERLTADNTALRYAIKPAKVMRSQEQDFNGAVAYLRALAKEQATQIEKAEAENAALREKVPQWISVEERRPEPGKRVLATDGVFVGEAYRTSADTWRRYDGIAMRDCIGSVVTHWMPLPEAPEEGDKHE